ncbi:MAG: twitch domain-containing radical SAM protein [Bdellovibrionaceae bacterium]|nr:twitch domain-containing radical SAM protein [Pseudobdellovibrionaceae bacterium]
MRTADGISPTFCVMPWINLGTETNGKCKICCVVSNNYIKKDDGSDYHIHHDPIEEIFNSGHVRNVRRQMLKGEWPEECAYCRKQDETGSPSPRHSYNSHGLNEKILREVEISRQHDGASPSLPLSLEPRPGTLCNLKCTTCWSLSSSKVFSERQSLLEDPSAELPAFLRDTWDYEVREAKSSDFRWAENAIYLENVRRCMPTLERIYFTGGEPTLIASNRLLLRELLAQGRNDVLISFTTNLTVMDEELLRLAKRFKRLEVTGSIDAHGEANEYIRYPTRFADVSRNIDRWMAEGVSLTLMSVVQIANLESFVRLLQWLAIDRPYGHLNVMPTLLQNPAWLRPELLPQDLKRRAFGLVDEALNDPRLSEHNRHRLKHVREQILHEHPEAEHLRGQFRSYTRILDKARGTCFEKTFPHLASLMREPEQVITA